MGFLLGVVSNVLANVIFWIFLGATFWLVSTVAARRFSRFFGLRRVRSIAVYLSNLWTPGPAGRAEGYTISLHELRAARSVDNLFGSAPLRLPELVRGLVDALWLRKKIQCDTLVSPSNVAYADLGRNLIVVGGSVRNSVRAQYVKEGLPSAVLIGEDSMNPQRLWEERDQAVMINRDGNISETQFTNLNVAVLEKCYDADRRLTAFFCFGARGDSSWAAVEYLVRNWKGLAREFGDGNFLICLGFPLTERYLEDYREPRRLTFSGSRASR